MQIYTVAQVVRYLKELIEADRILSSLWVEGEVSNLSRSAAGHLYFTLKDTESQIRCVMFRGQLAASSSIVPSNGMAVIVHGRLSVYEPQGVYQLYVDLIQPEGVGLLQLQFERLRAQLEREGFFDPARKRPLPRFPQRIGVVTSLGGAVVHDIINVISRRFPATELVIAPCAVQGPDAAQEICDALQALNCSDLVDVIILARGGGSTEELWPFNEEIVARAIFGSRVPVIAGIGHETDFTIADLVADCRAPTPSAAAELAVPHQQECRLRIDAARRSLQRLASGFVESNRSRVARLVELMERASPSKLIDERRQRLDDLVRQAALRARHTLDLREERLQSAGRQLASLNPVSILRRGYSVCVHEATGQVVKSVQQVAENDYLKIRVFDGTLRGKVVEP